MIACQCLKSFGEKRLKSRGKEEAPKNFSQIGRKDHAGKSPLLHEMGGNSATRRKRRKERNPCGEISATKKGSSKWVMERFEGGSSLVLLLGEKRRYIREVDVGKGKKDPCRSTHLKKGKEKRTDERLKTLNLGGRLRSCRDVKREGSIFKAQEAKEGWAAHLQKKELQ